MNKFYPIIPYFETTRIRVKAIIDLANIKPGEKTADLGSGDGRISLALSKVGAHVTSYELDQSLVLKSQENIRKANIHTIQVLQKDFWGEDLSSFNVIVIYPMPDIMDQLEEKLKNELRSGSRILTNYYTFNHWKEKKTLENIHLYIQHSYI